MKDKEFSHLMFRAWLRDGDIIVSGEALMLACLLHAKGKGRQTADMKDVQRIMKDANLRPTDRTE